MALEDMTARRVDEVFSVLCDSVAFPIRVESAVQGCGRTRMMIEAGRPGWPMRSVARAVTRVSPSEKAISAPMPSWGQNWVRVWLLTKEASCDALRVQASLDVVRTSKRQARS